jgi:hypothetical protein
LICHYQAFPSNHLDNVHLFYEWNKVSSINIIFGNNILNIWNIQKGIGKTKDKPGNYEMTVVTVTLCNN